MFRRKRTPSTLVAEARDLKAVQTTDRSILTGQTILRNLLDGPILVRVPEGETLPCRVKPSRTALDVVGRDLVHKLGVPSRAELEPDSVVSPADGQIAGKRGIGRVVVILSARKWSGNGLFRRPILAWNHFWVPITLAPLPGRGPTLVGRVLPLYVKDAAAGSMVPKPVIHVHMPWRPDGEEPRTLS